MVETEKPQVSKDLRTAVAEAVRRSQEYFTRTQSPEGFWWGELESNPTMEAEYLLLTHFLGIGDTETWPTTYSKHSERTAHGDSTTARWET